MTKKFLVFYLLFFSFIATSQTVDFTFQSTNGLFCTPATIQFTQNVTGNPTGFIWSFGNGLKSFTANPSTSYIFGGSYTVKLIAIYATGAIEISKTVVISPTIIPAISVDRNYICQPGIINFTASSNGNISNYDWDFGDGTGINPTPLNTISHSFANYGTYTVNLKATDATGCFGQDTAIIDVTKLPITASVSPTSGCIPVVSNFTSSVLLPVNGTVSSYLWDFGDGSTPQSTTTNSTSHNYNTVGSFSPTLNITTNEGCTNTFNFSPLAFGTPPTNHIAYPQKTTICGWETAIFVAKATNANSYFWDFGDGTTTTVTDTITQHKYRSLGVQNITVTPLFNGCPGTPISFQITVTGVISLYVFSNSCASKNTYSFINTSQGPRTNLTWSFGDGSPSTNIDDPVHTFPASGQFNTSLIMRDPVTGCTDTLTTPIYTATPTLINADIAICRNASTTFTISNNYTNPAANYTWNVMGSIITTGTTPTVTLTAGTLGNFNNYVIISQGNPSLFCPDTVRLNHSILVRGPLLDFTVPPSVCLGDTLFITNNSGPFIPADTVTLWYWNYGNSLNNDTIYQPDPIFFGSVQTYQIKLTAIDKNGCIDSLVKPVPYNPIPFLQLIPKGDTLCLGQSDSLFAFHSDPILWSPSAGLSCNTCDTVIANPTVTTQYIVTSTTAFNCTVRDSVLITVIPPFTATVPSPNTYICMGEQDTLDVNPKDKVIVWSPVTNLSNPNIYNPIVNPTQTTTYTATLTDSLGCFSSTVDVTVFLKTNPTVDAGPDRIVPYNSTFTISPNYSSNVSSYLWTPSTLLNCSTCATPNGTALNTETYTIQVTSDSGCVASDIIIIGIECNAANLLMPKAFTPNNDNLNDFYYPLTRGIKTILKFSIYNRAGQIVYQAQNFTPNAKSFGWNGNFKGTLQPAAAYIYILEALCEIGQRLVKSGSFLLLR